VVGLAALVTGVLAQLWAHRADAVLAFWDAQAHLDIARRLVDSTTPGLQMLGTVWLPVPHLLYLPFTLVDPLWWSGLAGGLVGLAALVATAIAVSDIVRRHTSGRAPALVAAAAVILNPSLLYLQTTAMTEPLLLAFLTGSVALIDRWRETPARSGLLWLAGLLAALAVGSRYDGWFFAAMATAAAWWHRRRLADALRFALLPGLLVIAWLWYNQHFFGDPLEFQRGAWSAASQQADLAERGLLPTKGAPLLGLGYFLGAVGLTAGWVLLLAGIAGSLASWRSPARLALLLLWSALPFNLLALWAGQSAIALPWTDPAGVLNVRYGLMLLPALAVALGLGMGSLAGRRGTVLALVGLSAAQVALWTWQPPDQVGALREGLAIRDGDRRQMNASQWLERHYDRGRVLVAPAVNVSPRTRIALRDRVYPWTWQLGESALAEPSAVVDWVILDRRRVDDPVTEAVAADTTFHRQFLLAFDEQGLEIWQRR
jgi:hypothetical protein